MTFPATDTCHHDVTSDARARARSRCSRRCVRAPRSRSRWCCWRRRRRRARRWRRRLRTPRWTRVTTGCPSRISRDTRARRVRPRPRAHHARVSRVHEPVRMEGDARGVVHHPRHGGRTPILHVPGARDVVRPRPLHSPDATTRARVHVASPSARSLTSPPDPGVPSPPLPSPRRR